MREDEIKLWDTIWEKGYNKGLIPTSTLAKELKIPRKRVKIILQRWMSICLINHGRSIWNCWIEHGISREDLKHRRG